MISSGLFSPRLLKYADSIISRAKKEPVMYLMYVDESGDAGLIRSPTRYFTLTGMVLHELRWHDALRTLIAFRQRMRSAYGLLMREEIHASRMLTRPGPLVRIRRNDRLAIIRHLIDELSNMDYISFINVRVDKLGKHAGYDAFEWAWRVLIQRFENTLNHRNFPGPANPDDRGTIFCDETDGAALRKIYRRMRVYNPVPNLVYHGYQHLPIVRIVEDPTIRRSDQSYFIQAVDAAAFALYQWYAPSRYVRTKGARNLFRRLDPVLCKAASRGNALGIVEL